MNFYQYIFAFILLFKTPIFSQDTSKLNGTWIVEASAKALDSSIDKTNKSHHSLTYLKFTFKESSLIDIANHYAANTHFQKFLLKNKIITFSTGRQFLIEKLNAEELVLVELEQGKIGVNSIRYWFVREQIYLDKLPLKANDSISINGKIVYRASKKLYPKFKHKKYPDFHIYMDNSIKNNYKAGENFYLASFVINPDGKIDNIKILHRVNEKQDKKILRAIKRSEGMWTLPKLNGNNVPILHFIEDRVYKEKKTTTLNFTPYTFKKYSNSYYKSFHQAMLHIQLKKYKEAIKHISYCERIYANEPNLIYHKMVCYQKLGNPNKAKECRDLLKQTQLKYLLNKN